MTQPPATTSTAAMKEEKEARGFAISRKKLDLHPGAYVGWGVSVYKISGIEGFTHVFGKDVNSGRTARMPIAELYSIGKPEKHQTETSSVDLGAIGEDAWGTAMMRYRAIEPLLGKDQLAEAAVIERAKALKVGAATLYRWLQLYESSDSVDALVPRKRGRRPGTSRVSAEIDKIITDTIEDTYLTTQRKRPQEVCNVVAERCKEAGLPPPHDNTVRARIAAISEHEVLRRRGHKKRARGKFHPVPGEFPRADYPLAVVQIDHTPVDIIVVDDEHRQPIQRPYLTLAIDVFSRMIVGYHLSLDPPSGTSVAMCISHAVLPKEDWLRRFNIDAPWDVWGVMDKIHVDNAGEFRSPAFMKSCAAHGIDLEFRKLGTPEYGGHIERLLGTILRKVHNLPGTTFSSIVDRLDYDAEGKACMTLSELEEWLLVYITQSYHVEKHASLDMSPARKWEIGIFGAGRIRGRGLPKRVVNGRSFELDFLPAVERTIHPYGVEIDKVMYYADALRPWINAAGESVRDAKRKFIFRRDPRDISKIHFFDPKLEEYFEIATRKLGEGTMSLWEHREAKRQNRALGMDASNSNVVAAQVGRQRKIVEDAQHKTKRARRAMQRHREHAKGITPANPFPKPENPPDSRPVFSVVRASSAEDDDDDDAILPFYTERER